MPFVSTENPEFSLMPQTIAFCVHRDPLDMVDKINGRQIAERTGCAGFYNKIGL
jgi:hypothetical protein